MSPRRGLPEQPGAVNARILAATLVLLGIPRDSDSRDLSTALVGISRVVAWLTICGVLHLTLSGGVAQDVAAAGLQWSLGIALALMLGNLARECTVSIAARLSVSLGREFRRVGATIDGKPTTRLFARTVLGCVVSSAPTPRCANGQTPTGPATRSSRAPCVPDRRDENLCGDGSDP